MSTFGVTTTTGYSKTASGYDDYIISNVAVSPVDNGFATSISFYCDKHTTNEGDMCFALYDSTDDTLIAQTSEVSVSSTEGWQTASFVTPPRIYSSKSYYITFWFEPTFLYIWQKNATAGSKNESLSYTGVYPDDIGTWDDTSFDYEFCIYCTYTPGIRLANSDSSTSFYLNMPSSIIESTTKTIENLVFNDGTDAQLDRGKTGDSLTLSGTETTGCRDNMASLNSFMDSQYIVTVDGLPDSNLNTDYRISNLDFTHEAGFIEVYNYNITLERIYDRLG